jgi:hypothetical protein
MANDTDAGHAARYFVAVFGDPGNPPDKDLVESGRYIPDPKYAPFPVSPGDFMLLYCTEKYPGHPKEVPGMGLVTRVDQESVEYRWVPFIVPISRKAINKTFEADDSRKLRGANIRFSSQWIIEISRQSFSKAVGPRASSVSVSF